MGLKKAIENLKEAVNDLSSLEVITITGTLMTKKAGSGANQSSVIDWKSAITEAKKTTGTVELVMATEIRADGDATLYIREKEIPQHMLEAHQQAVDAGLQVRSDIIDFAASTVKGLLD